MSAVLREEGPDRGQRGGRIGGGETRLRKNRTGFIADGAHEFCAAGLYGTEQSGCTCHIGSIA